MYFPIMIELQDKSITIIGGGRVAYRKAIKCLGFGAKIVLVSPSFIPSFQSLRGKVEMLVDTYKEVHLKDSFIVIAATDDKKVNKQIGEYCKAYGIFCNIASDPSLSHFIMPSVFRRGRLIFSVSTCGNSPSLSHKIKKQLEEQFDTSYERYVELLGELREKILQMNIEKEIQVKNLNKLVDFNLEELEAYAKDFSEDKLLSTKIR